MKAEQAEKPAVSAANIPMENDPVTARIIQTSGPGCLWTGGLKIQGESGERGASCQGGRGREIR